MKKFAEYKFLYRCAASLCMAACIVVTPACHKAKADGDSSAFGSDDVRPDEKLTQLMKSISEGNPRAFASYCVYPIQRKYPLRNIEDSASMVDYFPVMIDDSLKTIAGESRPSDWNFYGWRGWALGDSAILWFDEGLQFVDYESRAETGLRKMLAKDEIMSLLPEYRENWTPVETLIEEDGDKVFRIDMSNDTYRLMEFENIKEITERPTIVLLGTMDTEGSADYRIYVFTDSLGNTKAEYSPDSEPPIHIEITTKGKPHKSHKVKRGYWRDIMQKK